MTIILVEKTDNAALQQRAKLTAQTNVREYAQSALHTPRLDPQKTTTKGLAEACRP
jgi:hypothetical protein